ncbi:BON domain-containing protein [Aliikangiella sp. IMCC44359]|uniref:BON domain-containing protein n=1 Tax=Aliikangiella sp. IMCC44359 TaxID=3459125 RepID=UPI00403AB146
MNIRLKKSLLPVIVATSLSLPAIAGDKVSDSAVKDAWLDGKLDTVVLLNKHLNPLKIETDVTNGIAVITGKVDTEVEKDLMTELAKSIDGIKGVENHLNISKSNARAKSKHKNSVINDITDASITTAISTKLLLNTEIDSTEIDVNTNNKIVTLNGNVKSEAERDLVYQIAKNTFEVSKVKNNLNVSNRIAAK